MSASDNEWAAKVMGWEVRIDPEFPDTPYYADGQRELFDTDCWNPDTDANDFRELLNCEAVQAWVDADVSGGRLAFAEDCFLLLCSDQPAALRQLREAMEATP